MRPTGETNQSVTWLVFWTGFTKKKKLNLTVAFSVDGSDAYPNISLEATLCINVDRFMNLRSATGGGWVLSEVSYPLQSSLRSAIRGPHH